jgi:hypothetical protein
MFKYLLGSLLLTFLLFVGVDISAQPLPNTLGQQNTLVILVNFQDNTSQPYTVTSMQSLMASVNDFMVEASYGQTSVVSSVGGWYTISMNAVCSTTPIKDLARQAATNAGYDLTLYNRFIYAFPLINCFFSGVTIGSNDTWINGTPEHREIVHELGHQFGLEHAHGMECGSLSLCAGTVVEYGDDSDTMGSGESGHYNAFHKERLGWLNFGTAPPIQEIVTGGTYSIPAYALQNNDPKALKILKSVDPSSGHRTYYYLEYRQPIGFDATISRPGMYDGVLVKLGTELEPGSSFILDMTPNSQAAFDDWSDARLQVGHSYYDSDAQINIQTLSLSASLATVLITFGPPPPPPVTHILTVGSSNTATGVSISVTPNDNSGLGSGSTQFTRTYNEGSTITLTAPSVAGSNNFQKWLKDGVDFSTNLSVSIVLDVNHTLTAVYTTPPPPVMTVTLTTDKLSYTRGQNVISLVTVKINGSPTNSASVTFLITKSNGSTVSQTLLTGTNGTASYTYKIKPNDPTGTYTDKASATASGLTGSASKSFTVQ